MGVTVGDECANYTRQDIWDAVHDGLLLPRCRLRRVSSGLPTVQFGVKAGRSRYYEKQLNISWTMSASDSDVVASIDGLAAQIADYAPFAFGRLPLVQDWSITTWHLESARSMVRARLILGDRGAYPLWPFDPFERVFRLDVLLAK